MERVVTPYICYEGEGNYPATRQYIIWYRCARSIGKAQVPELVECHLAYTDEDGKLHPLDDDDLNPTFNKVTLDEFKTGKVFTIHNLKRWEEVEKESSRYKQPVRFGAADFVGMFFLPYYFGGQISLQYLLDNDLIREGKILRGKNSPQNFSPDDKYWIALPCDYLIYLARLRALVKELNKRLKAASERIGFLMACSTMVDHAGNLVVARSRSAWSHYFLKLPKEKKALASYVNFETRLIQWELIEPLKDFISNKIKNSCQLAKKRINEVAAELKRLLENPKHNERYKQYFENCKDNDVPGEVRESYMHAYNLLSRTEVGEEIYNKHIKQFVQKFSTKDKDQWQKAIEEVQEKASWVRDFKDEIMAIVEAYGTLKLSKELGSLRNDLIAASRFLEARGIAHNIDKLEEELNKAIVSPYGHRINTKEYFNLPEESWGWIGFNLGVNALTVANVLIKEHKTIKDKIESSKEMLEVMQDLSEIEWMADKLPRASHLIGKVSSPITSIMDWGLSVHSLYEASDRAKIDEFSLAFASYCGKGLVMGGTILTLTPFAPLGLILLGVGGAIDLLSDFAGFLLKYENVLWKHFKEAFEKIEKLDNLMHGNKGTEIFSYYEALCSIRISQTKYYHKLLNEPELRKAIEKKWTSFWENKPLTMREFVEKYFNSHYWGLIQELT